MAGIAYGKKENIQGAIDEEVIKQNTLIVTKDIDDPELYYYDAYGNILPIVVRTRFDSLNEAEEWVRRYPCPGKIITIKDENDTYTPCVVLDDGAIVPLSDIIDTHPPLQEKTQVPSVHDDIPVTPDTEYYGLSAVNVTKVPYEEVYDKLGGKNIIIGERN